MNSFETDLKRAVISIPFITGVILELIILLVSGADSDLFKVSIPVLATFPYSTVWLMEYQSGFIKEYIPRCNLKQYILGKLFACGISGGSVEFLGCWIYMQIDKEGEINLELIFVSGVLWAVLAAMLAAWSNSRYIAYGGPFVVYYILVILYERYFEDYYCLYPYEWIKPEHIWIFDKQGIIILMSGITLILAFIYYCILGRQLKNV